MTDSPEQVLRRYYQQVWVEGNVDALDELLAPDYRDHDPPPGYAADRIDARRLVEAVVPGMHEAEFTILGLVGDAEHAAAQWRLEWTQQGPWIGYPAADG